MGTRFGAVAGDMGRGLAAGVVGTAAMTAASTAEARLRGRGSSSTPAQAAAKVLGVEPQGERAQQRFNHAVHWAYGTGWGGARGLIAAAGLGPVAGTAAHLGTVWGAEQLALPATGTAPPATQWGAKEVAIDLFHHTVYAVATGLAFAWLAADGRR